MTLSPPSCSDSFPTDHVATSRDSPNGRAVGGALGARS